MKNKIYIIDGKTYLSHINDEVHLYGLLHQLAFLAGRIKDEAGICCRCPSNPPCLEYRYPP